jgi:carnitine O-acetyltransferase
MTLPDPYGDQDLPPVPLPTPADSVARFLDWCAPLLTDDQLAETTKAADDFLAGPAEALHAELARYAETAPSWLDDFWAYRYLGRRDRIALNANFFFLLRGQSGDQVERAAALTETAVDLYLRIRANAVPRPERRSRPLSSVQLPALFGTTRIPGVPQDTVRHASSDHVVVFRRGRMFALEVLDGDGALRVADSLRSLLAAEPEPHPVGPLTTGARAQWAADREGLDPAARELVETALFCVCLEDLAPPDDQAACDTLLAGDSANRWFDKALTLVVFPDGRAGVNVEHCELDGTTVLQAVEELVTPVPATGAAAGEPREIAFGLSDRLRVRAAQARREFADYAAATATRCLAVPDFGSRTAKELGVSPDALVQLAYQLAHRRAKGLTGATYESIATREYRHGRTEAMRVVTPEIVRFADVFTDEAAGPSERRAAFDVAAAAHVARARDCQQGRAPEQHLWELARRGGADHALFATPGWLVMRDDYLSTSSAPSETVDWFGFGSTSDRCIGVAYVLLPERFHLYLSTPRAVAEQMEVFADELVRAVAELTELLS